MRERARRARRERSAGTWAGGWMVVLAVAAATCLAAAVEPSIRAAAAPDGSAAAEAPLPPLAATPAMRPVDRTVTDIYDAGAPAGARPTALAAADFDSDGMPDLVTGYAEGTAGLLVLQRGNPASIFPHLSGGTSQPSVGEPVPFLPSGVVVETSTAPDFLVAGDFDNDGDQDIVTAARRGTRLFLHPGDGAGAFGPARQIDLDAEVTLLTGGEVNRVDRLLEMVVGTDSPAGAQLRVFESPRGAWNGDPEIFSLPAPATAATLGDHNRDGQADIAIVAGSELVLIRGRDRRLAESAQRIAAVPAARMERATLSFASRSISFGDFTGRGIGELAVLSDGGTVDLIDGATARSIVEVETGARGGKLIAAKGTAARGDDLILVEHQARKLHILAGGSSRDSLAAGAADRSIGNDAGTPQPVFIQAEMRSTLEIGGEPVDALPMRLNRDAIDDLIVLRDAAAGNVVVAESSPGTVYTVTNTNDSGAGSLRRAINDANFNIGADSIYFSIPGAGPHSIHALSDLPQITDPVTIDATTQTGYAGTPVIEIHGTVAEPGRQGLYITAGNSMLRGLAINRFSAAGIRFDQADGNLVESNFIGTNLTGTTALANGYGILVYGSSGNVIGGRLAGQGNVISGNDAYGVYLSDEFNVAFTTDTPKSIPDGGVVTSTLVATDTRAIEDLDIWLDITHPNVSDLDIYLIAPNATRVELSTGNGGDGDDYSGTEFDDEAGIAITDEVAPFVRAYRPEGSLTVVDGLSMAGTWTLEISDTVASNTGTLVNWDLQYSYNLATGNEIEGNRVGTDAGGTVGIANAKGIGSAGSFNFIGAPAAGAGNLVSGNISEAIHLGGPGNVVQRNLVGTDVAGTSTVGAVADGIWLEGDNNLVGGAAIGAGNVITVPLGCGVNVEGSSGNVVQGNFVGTDVTGMAVFGDTGTGICIEGGVANVIGGATAETRNLIAGLGQGIEFTEILWASSILLEPFDNIVIGNYIGTDIAGAGRFGNLGYGISLDAGHDNVIEDGNVVCQNESGGVWIGPDASANLVALNRIGIDVGGAPDPGNVGHGVVVEGKYNTIEANVISGNVGHGISVSTPDTPATDVLIDTNPPSAIPDFGSLATWLDFTEDATVLDLDVQIDIDHTRMSDLTIDLIGPDGTTIRLTERNGGNGTGYDGTTFDDEAVQSITAGTAPFIGSYRPEQPLAAFDGKSAKGSWALWVYDDFPGATGTQRDYTIMLRTIFTQGNEIRANTIGLDGPRQADVPNLGAGVHLEGVGNLLDNNTVAGNLGPGVLIIGEPAVGNILTGNSIGFESPGSFLIHGNGEEGVQVNANVSGSPLGNRIGVEGNGNAINYNVRAGVHVYDGASTSIRCNAMGSNGGLGIDLGPWGVTLNDPLDADGGPNGLQNYPEITLVAIGATETVIEGFLASAPEQTFSIDLHVWQPDPSGYGEGDWIASQVVTTSPAGVVPFSFTVPGTMLYPTAVATALDGSSSEFSGAMSNLGGASEAGDMTAASLPGGEIIVSYFPACGATNHAIYWGVSPIAGALNWTDVECFVGTEGNAVFDPGDPPLGQVIYFAVAGQNYAHEGSYGRDSLDIERPEAGGFGVCDRPQVIATACP